MCHVSPDVPDLLVGDPDRLRQVIVNLVGNALKFTERGEVVLAVRLEAADAQQAELQLRVSDTGPGIPQHKCATIFDAFVQADHYTTRRYGGSGLGLAISRQIVEMMGGACRCKPRRRRQHVLFHGPFWHAAGTAPSDLVPDLAGAPVLLVDDNDSNRLTLNELLTHWRLPGDRLSGAGRRCAIELAAMVARSVWPGDSRQPHAGYQRH